MHMKRRLFATLIACAPALAFAHPGHEGGAGFAAGLAHPLLGVDHLAAALLVGAWAAHRGGSARLGVPVAFIVALVAGFVTASTARFSAGPVEQLVAASVLVAGLALTFAWRLPATLCVVLAGTFALFHGIAHGIGQTGGNTFAYGAGLVLATATLLATGEVAALLTHRWHASAALRWAGAAGIAGGLALLAVA
jgi:urease accessory protein